MKETDIPDTMLSRHTEYTDSRTGKIVPVDVKYTTSYSANGITCKEELRDGDNVSNRELWSMEFDNEDGLSRVKDLLDKFSDENRLTFATQKGFWSDFLAGNINVEDFKAYYKSTNDGIVDFEGQMADGRSLRDIVNEPYAEYLNNNSFVGHVWTEQEMWDNWYGRIDASRRASAVNGLGIEPPTDSILTTNSGNTSEEENPLWHWHDGIFGFYAEVYKNHDADSEYILKLRYDDGREEERVVDVDKIDASNCNILDLHVKMYHLRDEGKIGQNDVMMNLALAHIYMEYRTPDADTNTNINFRSWYEKQLDLEMNNGANERNMRRLLQLLKYL